MKGICVSYIWAQKSVFLMVPLSEIKKSMDEQMFHIRFKGKHHNFEKHIERKQLFRSKMAANSMSYLFLLTTG